MPKKHESETLRQRKKAQQDFLTLKKMQSGEIDAGPKPSEIAIQPRTFSEKLKNIWFHDKWYIIIVTALIAAIAFVSVECATKTKYDLGVVVFTYSVTGDNNCKKMAEYLKPYCEDINGDGEVNISVINCSLNNAEGNNEFNYAARTRVQTVLSSDASSLLFITDPESYAFLTGLETSVPILEGEPVVFSEDFYEFCKTDDLFSVPDELQISCRNIKGATISNDENVNAYYNEAQNILNGLRNRK